jgi:hypothetical protein
MPDGDHRYVLLANSLHGNIYNPDGLSTRDCLRFLLDTKTWAGKKSALVGFAFNYDINMMLRDLGKKRLVELWQLGSTRWYDFKLSWIPSKMFTVTEYKRTARVYDTFGFFQCSFAKALAGWDVPAPEQLDEKKASRSSFTEKDIEEITTYCYGECEALVTLMTRLEESLHSVNLTVKSWVGAGSIAGSLLRREKIHEQVAEDSEFGDEVYDGIMSAYFGGRTELFKQGEFASLQGYDIRSAYPFAMQALPSLVGSSFRLDETGNPNLGQIALCYVRWECDPESPVQPFPVRSKRTIQYPFRGEGWYWSCEVAQALQVHPGIEIIKCYTLDHPDKYPFRFINDVYLQRAKLKDEGHFGQQSLKLAINALYGKLAQGIGWEGKTPPFRSYVWAGWITAQTRARMMQLASADPDAVVMICTDGIYFDREQEFHCDNKLGGLEASTITRAFVAQPGIYTGETSAGELVRSRGVFAKEIDFDDLRKGYADKGPYYVSRSNSTRFIGVGACVVTRSFDLWRRWHTAERRLSLYPSKKFIRDDNERPTVHMPSEGSDSPSEPYEPKRSGMDAPGMLDWIEALDQPLREEPA